MPPPGIIIYLERKSLPADKNLAYLELYGRIERMCAALDIPFEYQFRKKVFFSQTPELIENCDDGNLHIVDDGFIRAPNVLNAGLAYLNGFWHLDPRGIRFFSSATDAAYDPDDIKFWKARNFHNWLFEKYAADGHSRYSQPKDRQTLQCGSIGVFFQGKLPVKRYKCTKFSDIDMLNAVVAGSTDEVIYVKMHPREAPLDDVISLGEILRHHPRVQLVDANIHDILPAVDVAVSINSSVSIEGFIHKTPAIHFGASDLGHLAETVTDARDFAAALARARTKDGGFIKFLYWYFKSQCLEARDPDIEDKIWAVFATAGFPKSRFLDR